MGVSRFTAKKSVISSPPKEYPPPTPSESRPLPKTPPSPLPTPPPPMIPTPPSPLMIVSGRRDMTADADPEAEGQLGLRYHLAAAASDAYFEAGFNVIVQDIILGEWLPGLWNSSRVARCWWLCLLLAQRQWSLGKRTDQRLATASGPLSNWTKPERKDPRVWIVDRLFGADPEQTAEEILQRAWTEAGVD